MWGKKDTLSSIFQETENFLQNLDPKRCSPPFIVNVFLPIRNKAYQRLVEDGRKNDKTNFKMKLKLFIEKFEGEYIDLLRTKLLDKYIDYIQNKRYNMPR